MIILIYLSKEVIPVEKISTSNSIWFWIAISELLLIFFLIYKRKSKKKIFELTDFNTNNIKNSKGNNIDMDNLMNSIHKSKSLYKELSKKCHPDRFINDPKQITAKEIFQEITLNERNFEKLSALKTRAIVELNIKF